MVLASVGGQYQIMVRKFVALLQFVLGYDWRHTTVGNGLLNMEAGRKFPANPKGLRHWLRVLRPLEWWFLLVLFFYGLRTHERLSANTRLVFSPTLNGKPVSDYEFTASVDGKPIRSRDLIRI